MGRPHLSRHFLASSASSLAQIPFAVAGQADDAGVATTHNCLALTGWNEDAQAYHLALADFAVGYTASDVAGTPRFSILASFCTAAAPSAVSAADLGDGSVALVTALADGSLSRLRLQCPTAPGSSPETIGLTETDFAGVDLRRWCTPHAAPAAAVAISAESGLVLSAGADGSLALTKLDDAGGSSSSSTVSHTGASFSACRWASPSTFVTTSLAGAVQVWDRRTTLAAAQHTLRGPPGQPRQPLLSLEVHPAQAHSFASGDAAGGIALWDLRRAGSQEGPVARAATCGGGVTGLAFDAAGRLLCCSSQGMVAVVTDDAVQVLHHEPGAAVHGLVVGAAGAASQIFAPTDQEVLLFMANLI